MDILGLHHVAVKTANFEAMRAFYTDVLGLPVVGGFAGRPIIFLGAGDTTIELVGGNAPAEPRGQGWAHVALRVASTDAVAAELTGRGVSFHDGPRSFPPDAPTARSAFFRDPDGNELELFEVLTPGG
jgi:glyoxylase I family protein